MSYEGLQETTLHINPHVTFLNELATFTNRVALMPRFKGQTQVLRILRRIPTLAVFSN
jgi:hypothetical protein